QRRHGRGPRTRDHPDVEGRDEPCVLGRPVLARPLRSQAGEAAQGRRRWLDDPGRVRELRCRACALSRLMTSYENTVVLNYGLVRQLGAGGFGTVYLAEHVELGRKAACKILKRELVGHADAVERFFREARAACAIGHRAIVEIENFGRLTDGEPFYLMEYVAG